MTVEINTASPFLYFAGVWWCAVIFHFLVGLCLWLTKGGRWAEMLGG